jgi:hypothetical protein
LERERISCKKKALANTASAFFTPRSEIQYFSGFYLPDIAQQLHLFGFAAEGAAVMAGNRGRGLTPLLVFSPTAPE